MAKRKPKRGLIVLVANTKGGCLKTTTVINLAVPAALTGLKVALVDSDIGRSLTKWYETRLKRNPGLQPDFFLAQAFGGSAHVSVEKLAEHYDLVLVDAGGEGNGAPEIRLILTVADIVLTPSRPPEGDTVRLAEIHALIEQARVINPKLVALLVPVAASTNAASLDVVKFYRNVKDYQQFRMLKTVVRNRVAYQNWQETGRAVIETRPRDALAVAELEQLYAEVFNG
jgi:chromosome partitioning protein